MCDYSLENQISRAAEVGDKLVTSSFPMTPTRGFCAENEAGVAVCLLPGTELAFAEPVRYNGLWGSLVNYVKARLGRDMADAMLARFRQVDLDNPHTHHDAIELADGRVIKLSLLHEGQRARVLQLPAVGDPQRRHDEHARGAGEALAPAR
ncbi:hypothetical protein DK847_17870 [Aestuariivirga litoralis]|uniref:Uncharacterized protein n=1 Tax=Aestuariivirga litoralis TaxID=2650924 RepID=A0A2W2BQN9_9HYPH|nr:hypothetical protein [Aestuariivirga litoralis]PZF75706.1 hypothetical protein DK847_17870 [Aestuariivirga litoralis]